MVDELHCACQNTCGSGMDIDLYEVKHYLLNCALLYVGYIITIISMLQKSLFYAISNNGIIYP